MCAAESAIRNMAWQLPTEVKVLFGDTQREVEMMHSAEIRRFFMLVAAIFLLPLIAAMSMTLPAGMQQYAHDYDRDPVKAGYAVITPTSTATKGLVVFETFGERHGTVSTQAGVLPSDMTDHAMLFVSTNGRLARNLGVAIANPGKTDAKVVLTLRDDTGATVATKPFTIKTLTQEAKFVTQLFDTHPTIAHDFTGTLDVTSDVPVAIVGLRFHGENFSTLPATNLSLPLAVPEISAGVGGAAAVILAQFATGGGWASEIVLANSGPDDLTVRVDLFGQDGLPLVATLNGTTNSSFKDIKIPKGGVVVLSSKNSDDWDF
jgi:hypothetical protein